MIKLKFRWYGLHVYSSGYTGRQEVDITHGYHLTICPFISSQEAIQTVGAFHADYKHRFPVWPSLPYMGWGQWTGHSGPHHTWSRRARQATCPTVGDNEGWRALTVLRVGINFGAGPVSTPQSLIMKTNTPTLEHLARNLPPFPQI